MGKSSVPDIEKYTRFKSGIIKYLKCETKSDHFTKDVCCKSSILTKAFSATYKILCCIKRQFSLLQSSRAKEIKVIKSFNFKSATAAKSLF